MVKKKLEESNKLKWIFWIFILIFIGLEIYSIQTDSHYKWDFIFIVALWFGLYKLKDRIRLHEMHFFLFGIFLLLHNLGTFGTYKSFPLGMEYDFWVHGYFGFVASLILFRAYREIGHYRGWFMYLAIVVVVLGMGGLHEIYEYWGALLLGEGEGVLFVGAGDIDEWDAQKDMVNNVMGGLLALACYKLKDVLLRRKNGKPK